MSKSRRKLMKSSYSEIRSAYLSGKSHAELSMIYKGNRGSIQKFLKRNTPPEEWPLKRHPSVTWQTRSRRCKMAAGSVKPDLIMELVAEYCAANHITLLRFGMTRMGLTRSGAQHLYQLRSGKRTSVSAAYAARILRAIGEPVRKDMAA